jgi:hypothetical protein
MQLRAESYKGVQDSLARGDVEANAMGKRIVLPATFSGCPRQMHQLYQVRLVFSVSKACPALTDHVWDQDAMGIVRHYGKPDLFVTITCNPQWPEIKATLALHETPADRPDIVARVFRLKFEAIKDFIVKKGILGQVRCVEERSFRQRLIGVFVIRWWPTFTSLSFKSEGCHTLICSTFCLRNQRLALLRSGIASCVQRFPTQARTLTSTPPCPSP